MNLPLSRLPLSRPAPSHPALAWQDDVLPGDGGVFVLPGSHKALVTRPGDLFGEYVRAQVLGWHAGICTLLFDTRSCCRQGADARAAAGPGSSTALATTRRTASSGWCSASCAAR